MANPEDMNETQLREAYAILKQEMDTLKSVQATEEQVLSKAMTSRQELVEKLEQTEKLYQTTVQKHQQEIQRLTLDYETRIIKLKTSASSEISKTRAKIKKSTDSLRKSNDALNETVAQERTSFSTQLVNLEAEFLSYRQSSELKQQSLEAEVQECVERLRDAESKLAISNSDA